VAAVLVAGLGIASPESLTGKVYQLVNHALFKTLLFLCAGAIVHATGMTRLPEMGGLAQHRPVVTVAFVVGVAAISGVPPSNGYVSLGLIHHAVADGHPVLLVALTLAQVMTVGALARASYPAFFRRRDDDYDRIEKPSARMVASLLVLAGGCAFGALPGLVLDHLVRIAASSLTAGGAYARADLDHGGRPPVPEATFHHLDPMQLLVIGGTIVLGLLLAAWVVRHPGPRLMQPLQALHTGGVNDHATYAVLGTVVCVFELVLT
jgi:multicomponent Na+:H+ antiporter subunit D